MAKKELLELINSEHDTETTSKKKGGLYGYDLDNTQWRRLAVDATGQVKVTGVLSQSAADALYVKKAGDTMTGELTIEPSSGTVSLDCKKDIVIKAGQSIILDGS